MSRCPVCGEESPTGFSFCGRCGAKVAADTSRHERKVVSSLFADLVGFTERSHSKDPEEVQAALRPYFAQLKLEIESFGGTVEKFVGDAVVGIFGAPAAHEDDPERAVRAALGIQGGIAKLNASEPALDLVVRVAVCTGEALVDRDARPERGEGFVVGEVMNLASRLQGVAPPGGVVVDERTHAATEGIIEYEEMVPVEVKGKPAPVLIWRAIAVQTASREVRRQQPPFVGRRRELSLLRDTFESAAEIGRVHLVTITGEPGVGKSRLVAQLRKAVEERRRGVWLHGQCLPYGEGTALGPLASAVKTRVGIQDTDGAEEAGTKLETAVAHMVDDPDDRDWLLAWLAPRVGAGTMGWAAGAEEREAFRAWAGFFRALSQWGPLVLALEDIHWADASLLSLLEHLKKACADRPLLIVTTARPELFDENPGWGSGRGNFSTVSLGPLTSPQTRNLVSSLPDAATLSDNSRRAIVDRAGGNPLFAIEFARLVIDRGDLAETTPTAPTAPLPDNVHAIITARLDALPATLKEVIFDAAVVGEVFWADAVVRLSGFGSHEVLEALRGLAERDFIRPVETTSLKGQEEFAFLHLMVRDAAYSQIPRRDRVGKHQSAAEWTRSVSGEQPADLAERVAYHLVSALDLARAAQSEEAEALTPLARQALADAAQRVLPADAEAAGRYFRRALELTPESDPEQARLHLGAGESAHQAGHLDEAAEHYSKAIEVFRGQGNTMGAAETMVNLSRLMWWRGDTAGGRALLGEAVELLAPLQPSREFALASARMAGDLLFSGRANDATEWSEKALGISLDLVLPDVAARALQYRGLARCELGRVSEGLADLRAALDDGLRLGLGHETATAYDNLGDWVWITEGPMAGLEMNLKGVEFAERRGQPETWTWTKAETLWMHFDAGDWDEVLRVAKEVLDWDRAHGGNQVGVISDTYRARVMAHRGLSSEAALIRDDFLPRARRIGDPEVLVPALVTSALIVSAEAIDLIEELDGSTSDKPVWRARELFDAVEICINVGRADLGERLVKGAAEWGTRHRLNVACANAALEEAAGDHAGALAKFEASAAEWRSFGSPFYAARALFGAARCLAALGRDAGPAAGEAAGIFDSMGASEFVDRARSIT